MRRKIYTLAMGLLCCVTAVAQEFDQQTAYRGLYDMMRSSWFDDESTTGSADLVRNLFMANDLTSDEAWCIWSDSGIPQYNRAMPDPSTGTVYDLWTTIFYQINRCNAFLEQATGEDAETLRQRAEARALRALFFSYAIDLWGDVPLWLSTDRSTVNSRSSRQEVYDFVVGELQEVQAQLDAPETVAYGHFSRGAAQLLLARLYLNAEVYTGTARWAEAKEQAAGLINFGSYQLCSDYSRLFMSDNATNGGQREMIFPLEVSPDMTNNWGNTMYLIAATRNSDMPDFGLTQQWGGLTVRNNLLQKFNTTDDRYLFYGDGHRDGSTLTDDYDFYQGYACVKYTNLRSDDSYPSNINFPDTDFPLMRLAEAYLISAEADARLNGGTCSAEGLTMLNTLRQRAHAALLTRATLSDLADEWAREFYFEGLRRSTLIRFGLYSTGYYQWTGRGTDVSDLMPLPSEVVVRYGFAQNPGYEDFSYTPSSLTLRTPPYSQTTVDLQQFQSLRFTWERPADAATKLTYQLQVSLTGGADSYYVLTSTNDEEADVANTVLYNALKALGATEGSEVTAHVRLLLHGVPSNVVTVPVRMTNPVTAVITDMWCLTGSIIADGSWSNTASSVGTGMIPMYATPGNPTVRTYTGYFATGGYGFKITKNFDWSMQFGDGWLNGSESWMSYGNGGSDNTMVYMSGYYTITINSNYYYNDATVTMPEQNVPVYQSVSMPGNYNGWDVSANAMQPVTTIADGVNHDWCTVLTLTEDTELKFAANGSWDANWGATDFPYGRGVQYGDNIHVPAGTYKVVFNDITGHYLFLDPETGLPVSTDEHVVDGLYMNTDYATIHATEAATIKVSEVGSRVKVAELSTDDEYSDLMLVVNGRKVAHVAADGTISADEAAQFYANMPNVPVIRVTARLRGHAIVNGLGVYTQSDEFVITFQQENTYVVDNAYYYIGEQTGWNGTKDMPLTRVADGVFQLVWTVQPNSYGEYFKVLPERALLADGGVDWDDQVGAETNGAGVGTGLLMVTNSSGAWNLNVAAPQTYTLTVDFNEMTYTLEEGDTSGITELSAAGRRTTGVTYRLDGVRVGSVPAKGLYIRDGKKFVK